MRVVLLFFILTDVLMSVKGQNTYDNFSGYATVSSITASGDTGIINISNFTSSLRGANMDAFTKADINVGDIFWSSDCNRYVLSTIVSRVGTTFIGKIVRAGGTGFPAVNSRVLILREYRKNGFTFVNVGPFGDGSGSGTLVGINNTTSACVTAYYRKVDSAAIAKTALIVSYAGNGVPTTTPTDNALALALGSTPPYPLYKYDGSSWWLVANTGGVGTQDTNRIYRYTGTGAPSSGVHPPTTSRYAANSQGDFYEWDYSNSNWLFVGTFLTSTIKGNKLFTDSVTINKNLSVSGGINSSGSATTAALTTKGVVAQKDTVVSTDFTLDGSYGSIGIVCTGGSRIVTLPNVVGTIGWKFFIRKEEDSSNTLTIKRSDGVIVYTLLNKFNITLQNKAGLWARIF